MEIQHYDAKFIVLLLTVGFAFATVLGYITHKCKLSPLLGYLIAGYMIGPYSPGYVADIKTAEQLAEIGVILVMFGVGLHFRWQDLMSVKHIAIPGAIGQVAIATICGLLLTLGLGFSLETGIIYGFSISVASTMVLVRLLTDHHLLHSPQGIISMGWLIVEDIITVGVIILIPILALNQSGTSTSVLSVLNTIGFALVKVIFLIILLFTIVRPFIRYAFTKIETTHSRELYTLTILSVTFIIALGSSVFFGVSIALGSFLAGMMIGQTNGHKKVEKSTIPLQDVFMVIFFLTVGMLFNPAGIWHNWEFFLATLAIILIIKPLTAIVITTLLKQSWHTSLVIAVALAQIGEFSFILAEEAMRLDLIADAIFDVIVASSIISISINPLLFKYLITWTKR